MEAGKQLWLVESSVLPTLQKTAWIDGKGTKVGEVFNVRSAVEMGGLTMMELNTCHMTRRESDG